MAEIGIFLVNSLPCHGPHLEKLKGDVVVIDRAVLHFDFKAHSVSVRARHPRVNDQRGGCRNGRNPRKSMGLTCSAPERRMGGRWVTYRDRSTVRSYRKENPMQTMTTELEQLIGKVIGDLGGTANAALVIVGDRLGLYRTLAAIGPASSYELARKTGTHERYIREWLCRPGGLGLRRLRPGHQAVQHVPRAGHALRR